MIDILLKEFESVHVEVDVMSSYLLTCQVENTGDPVFLNFWKPWLKLPYTLQLGFSHILDQLSKNCPICPDESIRRLIITI